MSEITNEMVEAAAHVIAADNHDTGDGTYDWQNLSLEDCLYYRDQARRALRAAASVEVSA